VFVTVVIVVAPHGSHGHACFARIELRETGIFGNIAKCSIVHVAVQRVMRALAAVGDVEIVPAIRIEIDDRYSCSHGSDLRHDVVEPRIELWSHVLEMNAGSGGGFAQTKSVARESARILMIAGRRSL